MRGEFQCSSASRKFLNPTRSATATRTRRVSVLFSEPKIPQCRRCGKRAEVRASFSALQRAENSSMEINDLQFGAIDEFQCSSASRKFLNAPSGALSPSAYSVSVLFSEPKIPQSILTLAHKFPSVKFQCSSASRKFLNACWSASPTTCAGFSALQRAENSSIRSERQPQARCGLFQCSSASRKFLNISLWRSSDVGNWVSVLFSEPKIPQFRARRPAGARPDAVSVLFSEPKIPQCICVKKVRGCLRVSVLFSEPKIPQLKMVGEWLFVVFRFQCSSASRKFLNKFVNLHRSLCQIRVSVLFSEPKIPQSPNARGLSSGCGSVSVLFSEPKIPQFAASQYYSAICTVSVLFSEPKIPQFKRN